MDFVVFVPTSLPKLDRLCEDSVVVFDLRVGSLTLLFGLIASLQCPAALLELIEGASLVVLFSAVKSSTMTGFIGSIFGSDESFLGLTVVTPVSVHTSGFVLALLVCG